MCHQPSEILYYTLFLSSEFQGTSRERHNSEVSLISKPLNSGHPLILISKKGTLNTIIFLPFLSLDFPFLLLRVGLALAVSLLSWVTLPESRRPSGEEAMFSIDCMLYSYIVRCFGIGKFMKNQ